MNPVQVSHTHRSTPYRLSARTHVAHHGHVRRATPAAGPHDGAVSSMRPMGKLAVM